MGEPNGQGKFDTVSHQTQQLAQDLHTFLFEKGADHSLYSKLKAQTMLLSYMLATSLDPPIRDQVMREVVANLGFHTAQYAKMGLGEPAPQPDKPN